MLQLVLFYIFAAIAVFSAILVITRRNVIHSAAFLGATLFAVAGIFLTLHAEFLAGVQVIVYVGGILVLFVFVIMLLNLPQDEDGADRLRWLKFAGIPLGLFFLFLVVATLWDVEPLRGAQAGITGSPQAIGQSLFTDYLLPFEATSLLILIALVGAVIFAKKDI